MLYEVITILESEVLLEKVRELIPEVTALAQYMRHTLNPITVISVKKAERSLRSCFQALDNLKEFLRIVIVVDEAKNDIYNPYMLVWRVTNNT